MPFIAHSFVLSGPVLSPELLLFNPSELRIVIFPLVSTSFLLLLVRHLLLLAWHLLL